MRYIKRKIINDIENSKQKQRAVAFALTLKEKTSDSSVVRNYTPYKIWKLTGMAYKTIKKYIVVLEKMGLAEIINGDLYISLDTVFTNADKFGRPYDEELHRVIIHGILHLCGLNDKGPGEREIMEAAEDKALAMRNDKFIV